MSEGPSKTEKLAAARKKLREYQSQRKEQQEAQSPINEPLTSEEYNVTHVHPALVEMQGPSEMSISISDESNDNGDSESISSKIPIANFFTDCSSYDTVDNFFDRLVPASACTVESISKPTVKPLEPFVNVIHSEGENGAAVSEELINDASSDKPESASSTVDSSSDYTRKLSYSVTAQDSIEQPSCSDISELERKNEELVSTLVLEQKKFDDLYSQFLTYKREMETTVDEFKGKERDYKFQLRDMESRLKMQLSALDMITSEKSRLANELEISNKQLAELKDQVNHLQLQLNSVNGVQENFALFEKKYEELLKEDRQHRQEIEIMEELNSELTRNLELKTAELQKLVDTVERNQSTISMLEMKINQMGGTVDMETIVKENKSVQEELIKSQQSVRELQEKVQSLIFERDQTNMNYQNCITTLNDEHSRTQQEVQELTEENRILNEKLSAQINHIATLENTLQRNLQEQYAEKTDSAEDSEKTATIQKLEDDVRMLNELLQDKVNREKLLESKIYSMENTIEQLNSERADIQRLQNAVESDKVAASQAILQNNKLKTQYEELHDAFIALNDSKLELLERIEQEKSINQRLSKQISNQSNDNRHSKNDIQVAEAETNTEENISDENCDHLMNVNAMVQLQEKFKEVVNKMADLTDEKQQLEHLVLQLQSETETIGEYVALYQKQRYLLNQKTQEKDEIVNRVLKEKDELYRRVMHLSTLLQSVTPEDKANQITPNVKPDYNPLLVPNATGNRDSDGVLHPTCCYCSGRRIITV